MEKNGKIRLHIICDIDGTIDIMPWNRADALAKRDFKKYYSFDFSKDDVMLQATCLLECLVGGGECTVDFVTARSNRVVEGTREFIERVIAGVPFDNVHLYMRADNDERPALQVKLDIIDNLGYGTENTIIIDDDREVTRALEDRGFYTMLVRDRRAKYQRVAEGIASWRRSVEEKK